jgi:predicted nucleic acid-binding protein
MSVERAFVDTNVFIYLYSTSEPEKQQKAEQAINGYDRYVSTQVLNEFCNVAIRKMKLTLPVIRESLGQICEACNVARIDEATVSKALGIHERYRYSYYDSLMVASALENNCRFIITEDMADGQVIENVLTVRNIFSE